ncbi:MAG: molybdopterin-guanine dinucleotide biosynthesis protein B [Syntrophaceticus schinkii]|mgnify:FL=1|jgi:molybdopterin-guanine dinucleotide biosynthesis protein MobB
MAPVIFIAGYSNTGKTTLVKKLIQSLKEKGYRVAAIKHAAHGYDLDVQGRDTWHYCQAGADQVVVVGPHSLTMHQLHKQEPPLRDIYKMIQDVDLILVEGFKREPGPKVEIVREGKLRLSLGDELIAVVSDDSLSESVQSVPCFATTAVPQLAEFLIKHLSL